MSRVSPNPTKPMTPAPKTPASNVTTQVPQDKIAKLAYDKWCKRGCPQGTATQDWLEAEKELKGGCNVKR